MSVEKSNTGALRKPTRKPAGNLADSGILPRLGLINTTAIAASCIILAALTGFLKFQWDTSERWLDHAQDVETVAVRLFSVLQDAESGQRGFLLTGEDRYLEPHNEALTALDGVFLELSRLSQVDEKLQVLLIDLELLIETKIAELKQTIALYKQGQFEEALGLVQSDLGQNAMDGIRLVVDKMLQTEKASLEERLASVELFRFFAWVAFSLTIVAVITFSVSMYRRISSHIAAREIMEARLRAAVHSAQLANEAKSDFLASMSHELRTPLNAICGFSQLIENQSLGPIQNESYIQYAKDIHWSGRHLLSIINDILDLSKIEAGKLTLSPTYCELGPAISDATKLIEARGKRDEHAINVEIEDGLSEVYADPRSLRQILVNLLSNADKFSPPDKTIRVGAATGTPQNRVVIYVSDQGLGIAEEEIEIIMQPFGQARESSRVAHEGTGLGLPIVKHLVDLHGGDFRIESEKNVGTTVEVSFPIPTLPAVEEQQVLQQT
ncbi:MAG: CHASE3 domain-containing protein [Magnetovibrionaceae bacterium]